jgi:hypothetical protein
MDGSLVRQHGTAVRVTVRVQPRASRSGIGGAHAGAWRVRVQAPPVDGAANEAVCAVLAEALGVPRRDVRVISGAAARTKVIELHGLTAQSVQARLVAVTEGR